MHAHKIGPRAEYRQEQGKRITASPTLAEKFRKLKGLTVNVGYYAPEGKVRQRQLTYDVNLSHARSVLRLDCPSYECVRGDFELTHELAEAVAAHRKTATGELCCQGWHNKDTINKDKCHHVLRYELKLAY